MTDDDRKHVCSKNNSAENTFIYVILYEDWYEKLTEAHIATQHGARDRMYFYCKQRWVISEDKGQLFVNMCSTCTRKRVKPVKGVVVTPIVSEGFNARGQVDLIDFQSCPDGRQYMFFLDFPLLIANF